MPNWTARTHLGCTAAISGAVLNMDSFHSKMESPMGVSAKWMALAWQAHWAQPATAYQAQLTMLFLEIFRESKLSKGDK